MRLIIICSLFFVACAGQKPVAKSTDSVEAYTVSGNFQQKLSYCGGARPSQEMLDEFENPVPLMRYTIYIKKGTENSPSAVLVDSTKTDEYGNYSFSLPPGAYTLVSYTQLNKACLNDVVSQQYIVIADQACLDDWYKKGLIQFTVKDQAIANLDYLITKACDIPDGIPCLNYTGPARP